jgi:hypothetical protein
MAKQDMVIREDDGSDLSRANVGDYLRTWLNRTAERVRTTNLNLTLNPNL